MDYHDFLHRRQQQGSDGGFAPLWLPDFLFDFQRSLLEWAIHKGRAALFCDCGLGKTPMQLVWAENVVRHTNKPVLVVTPLAVSHQTIREAEKFGIACQRSTNGQHTGGIVVTNYERLHHFDPTAFVGCVCDESSAIKNFDGKRRDIVTAFMRRLPYRLLCTATAAPNDFIELGTSSEALGYLGYRDMLTMFFKQETRKDHLGWGRTKYRFRGHAQKPFWRWVCSWARACRKPSDLGFSDERFRLPPLDEREILIDNSTPRKGMLFAIPARDMYEEREERRVTIDERCERVASLAALNATAVIWCHLNDEGDRLAKLVPDAKQVKGSMSDDEKEEILLGFTLGHIRRLVTKPKIGCWGLNWQHCHDIYTFPSHSFEQYYQLIRRCWRFGQESTVTARIVTTEGEAGVMRNIRRKAEQADTMFTELVSHMGNELKIIQEDGCVNTERVPVWLS